MKSVSLFFDEKIIHSNIQQVTVLHQYITIQHAEKSQLKSYLQAMKSVCTFCVLWKRVLNWVIINSMKEAIAVIIKQEYDNI